MVLWELFKGLELNFTPTLERVKRACRDLGNPQNSYPSVIVGGTNGKGSTTAFLESLLRHHGLKTGRFVSPHLVDETERWRINNEPIDEATLKHYVERIKPLIEKYRLTYFESAMVIATLLFKEEGVHVGIIEAGLGGRWDASKVHSPLLTAITNVGLDHTKWLGETLEEIADDKTELIYPERTTVLGTDDEPLLSIAEKKAKARKSRLVVANRDFTFRGFSRFPETLLEEYTYKTYGVESAELGLYGRHQIRNAALGLTLFFELSELLGFKPDTVAVKRALKETRWEGRFEIVRKEPLLVLDGAHNPHALAEVLDELKHLERFPFIVYGTMRDKDWKTQLGLIRKYTDRIGLVEVNYHRSESLENLEKFARSLNFAEIRTFRSVREMLDSLNEDAAVLGSLYLIGEVKKQL